MDSVSVSRHEYWLALQKRQREEKTLKTVFEVEALFQDKESDRRTVTCPRCKMEWSSLVIPTDDGWLFDMVECYCGAELVPTAAVVAAYNRRIN